jgi:branched-chain amino acid aminotransferase
LNLINLNGKLLPADEAAITTDNRAFRYGYGIFETMLVTNSTIELGKYHWERLFAGADTLQFSIPSHLTDAWLEQEIFRTISENNISGPCRVRLQLYAGNGGMYQVHSQQPDFTIMCSPVAAHVSQLNSNGLNIGIAPGLKKSMDTLSNLKSCNALLYAIAAQKAERTGWHDALVCNTNEYIIESAIANIFWIKNDVVYTPPLSDGCVAGVMRHFLLQQLPLHGYTVQQKSLSSEMLLLADEVFLTNAVRRIKWVGTIGETTYKHDQTRKIYDQLFQH